MALKRKPFEDRFQELRQDRAPWIEAWKDLRNYIKPTLGFFDGEQAPSARGKKIDHSLILDGSPSRAARILSSGMISGLTSPTRPWFRLALKDKDLMRFKPVKQYLAKTEDAILGAFSGSNIYGSLYSIYEEVGTFCTGAMSLLEDPKDIIRTRTFTVGEYMLGCDHAGRVNAFAREYWNTVGQVVSDFGLNNVKQSTASLWKQNKRSQTVKCYHLIVPNDMRDAKFMDNQNMEWVSVYWEEGQEADTFLRVSGFRSFPILAPRWNVVSHDTYGKGPGWEALGDVKMLQKMQRDKLIALEKVIDPPMQADASVEGSIINTAPGGLTRSSSLGVPNAGVRPAYEIRPDIAAIDASIVLAKQAIMETYYADMFMMIASAPTQERTAREIAERHEEKLLMLGPVLERLESELLDPMVTRSYDILQNAQMLPEIPEELEGQDIEIEYISMLAQAQQMVGTQKLKEHLAFVGALAAIDPGAVDNIDVDKAAAKHGEMLGVSPDVMPSPDEIANKRDAKQKQQAAIMEAEVAAAGVDAAAKLGKTPMGTGSALDKVIEEGGE